MLLLFLCLEANGIISRFYFIRCTVALPKVIEKILMVRNDAHSSYIFMKHIDAVSLYLLRCVPESRQNNSTFFGEACISNIIRSALMPIPLSHL